ncbi:hypothetical protein PQR67_20925 [Paraburkholderia fungorum]|uniref:hypothetical protein n=1 Tax=Paraburkholderia fungorum TaxID=134537 RepID=UPI0038B8DD71
MTQHPDSRSTAAIMFRDELLDKGWPDDSEVAMLAGKAPGPEAATYAIEERAGGALLGVWSEPRHCFVYPDFQFRQSGAIRKEIAALLAVLPRDDDLDGWRRAFWLYSPHALLDERTPADVFPDAPMRVIKVAQVEFQGDSDATW